MIPKEIAINEAHKLVMSNKLDLHDGEDFRRFIHLLIDIALKEQAKEVIKYLNEEIKYLENHIIIANSGIKINEQMVNSWIHQTQRIKKELLEKYI